MQTDSGGNDEHRRVGSSLAVVLVVVALVTILLLPFLPLLLAGHEHVTLGSDRVEDFCRAIGIHDELSRLYGFVGDLIR